MWSRVLRAPYPGITALAKAKRTNHPLARKEESTSRNPQLYDSNKKVVLSRRWVSVDTEFEDVTLLEATTKQRRED
jgi:hypothetical protein